MATTQTQSADGNPEALFGLSGDEIGYAHEVLDEVADLATDDPERLEHEALVGQLVGDLAVTEIMRARAQAELEEAKRLVGPRPEQVEQVVDEPEPEDIQQAREAAEQYRIRPVVRRETQPAEVSPRRVEIDGCEFVRNWDPITIDGVELSGREYLRAKGSKQIVYLTREGDERLLESEAESSPEVGQFSYMTKGTNAMFLGMKLPASLRGKQKGGEVLEYFLDGIKEHGLRFVGTGRINKPLIAKMLSEAGLVPTSKDFMGVILPKDSDDPGLPQVYLLRKEGDQADMVTGNAHHAFYNEVSKDDLPKDGLTLDRSNLVALHTSYVPKRRTVDL